MRFVLVVVILLVLCASENEAQETSTFQVWFEETAATRLGDRWWGDLMLTQYLVNGSRQVNSISVAPRIQYSLFSWMLAETALFAEYSSQTDISDIVEIRPWVALRYTEVFGRLEPSAMVRLEFRYLYYTESDTWDDRYRLRIRLGTRVALSNERIAPDTWYGIGEVEFFRNLDDAPKEYFNSRIRLHVGLGYRIGDFWSTELHYMYQESRSYPDQPFDSSDNILRVSVRKFF
ncbi:MAG: DUF2490 domain-containing protein [Candidatus Kapabacteria bacterium]|nr:DUF2490 domain-containing protein [Candidatus Kapabacteria bacterium]